MFYHHKAYVAFSLFWLLTTTIDGMLLKT